MLSPMRKEWAMRFANSGAEALAMLSAQPAEVVVTDMRMPEMNGAQLLNEVMRRYPKTIRIILSGYADTEMVMQCIGGTHQFLSKPCDGETLRAAVARALELDRWISNDALKGLVTQMKTVPSLPQLYAQIVRELREPDMNLEKIGGIISQDAAMTAKILQLVNSAFFGLPHRICDPTQAIVQLGIEMVQSLVLAIHVFSESEFHGAVKSEIAKLHQHSLNTAMCARMIAELEGQNKNMTGEAFTAGLLHDIGRLVLLTNFADQCRESIAYSHQKSIPLAESERVFFGVNHAQIGAYLLGLWGLPIPLVESAMFHHEPRLCQTRTFTSLTAVHVANVLDHGQPLPLQVLLGRLDRDYLAGAGVSERVPIWWKSLTAPVPASSDEKNTVC